MASLSPLVASVMLLSATAAQAADREFCPERPGQATPPCIVDRGKLVLEVGALDWARSRDGGDRTDRLVAGDALVRFGVTDHAEVQVGWKSFERDLMTDATGVRTRTSGTGDVALAVKQALGAPDGPVAIKAIVTLPVGTGPQSSRVATFTGLLPIQFDLARGIQFALTPQVAAAANADGSGRHLAYGSAIGIAFKLSDKLNLATDFAAMRDDDPGETRTRLTAGSSLAWLVGQATQLDIGTVVALDAPDPDVEVYFGISRRF